MDEKDQNKKRKKKPDLNEASFNIVKKVTDEKSETAKKKLKSNNKQD